MFARSLFPIGKWLHESWLSCSQNSFSSQISVEWVMNMLLKFIFKPKVDRKWNFFLSMAVPLLKPDTSWADTAQLLNNQIWLVLIVDYRAYPLLFVDVQCVMLSSADLSVKLLWESFLLTENDGGNFFHALCVFFVTLQLWWRCCLQLAQQIVFSSAM